jgi:hypothetical protein
VSHGTVAGIVGLTGANGTFVLERVNATQLKLRGSVGGGSYTSGGLVTIDSTYATIAEVTDIADLGATANVIDTTAHDATNRWGSRIPTFLDTGNMRITLNHVPADLGHGALFDQMTGRTRRPVLIVLPDATKTAWHLTGFVTGWQSAMPVNGVLSAQIVLTGAGDLVLSRA